MMPRFEIRVDNISYQVTTRDPEILSRWLLELFTTINWTPATFVQAFTWPMPYPGDAHDYTDWVGTGHPLADFKTPMEFLDAVRRQVEAMT